MNDIDPKYVRHVPSGKLDDKAILGIAQAYGPYNYWFDNLYPPSHPDATWRALMVISALHSAAFITQAKTLLNSPDSRVRGWACYYLGVVNAPQAVECFRNLFNDPSPRVRYHARKACVSLDPEGYDLWAQDRLVHGARFKGLISDDDPNCRNDIQHEIEKYGHLMATAETEKETIDKALDYKVQIIVTDNQKGYTIGEQKVLDNMSGLNMTWDIYRNPNLRETIIVMFTFDAVEPIFLWQGGDLFLGKMYYRLEDLLFSMEDFMR